MQLQGWAIADRDGQLLTYPEENMPFAQAIASQGLNFAWRRVQRGQGYRPAFERE